MAKSSFFDAVGDKGLKSFEKHKGDETKFDSNARLPAGIENGIAKLTSLKIEKSKKDGKPYFTAVGIVTAPASHDGAPIKGLRTSIIEPVFDTPTRGRKTVDEHMEWILNEIRKLGLETEGMSKDEFEEAIVALVEDGPLFRFRTWKGAVATSGPYKDKEPRTNENWLGLIDADSVEASGDDDVGGHVDEEESEEEEAEEKPAKTSAGGKGKKPAKKAAKEEEPEEEEEEEEEESSDDDDEEFDVDAMVAKAKDEDDEDQADAQAALRKKAIALGCDEFKVKKAKTWEAVGKMITEAMEKADEGGDEEEEEEEEEEDETPVPKKGQALGWKNPKKKGKRTEVKVLAVDAKAKTVKVKDLDADKVVDGIPFAQLIFDEE